MSFWAGAMLAVAIFILGKAGAIWWRARRSMGWPSVMGVVEETWVRVSESRYDTDDGSFFSTEMFHPEIRYRYWVDGRTYEGQWIYSGGQTGVADRDEAEKVLAPYAAGRQVQVFYNPRNPSEALLQPGKVDGLGAMVLIALLFLAMAFWLVLEGG